MLRKRGSAGLGGLPTTLDSKIPDGSGKSIKMEAPLVKALRKADGFIKGTYIWLFISIFFIWGGWSWIRRNSASIILDCNATGCTLTMQTPHSFLPRDSNTGIPIKTSSRRKRKTIIQIQKDQLVRADNVKWDPDSQRIVENYGINSPTYEATAAQKRRDEADDDDKQDEGEGGSDKRPNKPWNQQEQKRKVQKQKKRNKNKYKKYNAGVKRNGGPDSDGNYDSYVLVFRDPLPPPFEEGEEANPEETPSMRMARRMAKQHSHMKHDPNSLASKLSQFAITDGGDATKNMEYIIHPRDFNLGQTRRLARTAVSKINAYAKGRRASCILRESRPVAWQGLVLLILGIFSLVLCLLLGQFWEEYDPTKVGSYRKRMAEIRRREEVKKSRLKRNFKRPPLRRPAGSNAGRSGGISAARKSMSTGSSTVSKNSSTGTGSVRARPNAAASAAKDSWVASGGGVANAYTKRGY